MTVVTLVPKDQSWPDGETKSGRPKGTCANTRYAIEKLGIRCCYDEFQHEMLIDNQLMDDQACKLLRVRLHETFGLETGRVNTEDAIAQLAYKNSFHPVCNYLESLRWDGTTRINRWLIDYLGAPNTSLVKEVSRISLIAGIRRVLNPGTKFDQIIVLEGKEGKGKSSALAILAVEERWFSDQSILGVDDRNQQEMLSGKWIYEIAELHGLQTTSVEKIKAFASRQFDRARPAYGRFVEERGRTCVIFGTTNEENYLLEGTGHRRIWPIKTGKIDLEGLKRDVDQLWAEAYQREEKEDIALHEVLWESAAEEQEARISRDEWNETITRWLKSEIVPSVSIMEVATKALDIRKGDVDERTQKRIGRVLRSMGWEKKRSRVPGGFENRFWPSPPQNTKHTENGGEQNS